MYWTAAEAVASVRATDEVGTPGNGVTRCEVTVGVSVTAETGSSATMSFAIRSLGCSHTAVRMFSARTSHSSGFKTAIALSRDAIVFNPFSNAPPALAQRRSVVWNRYGHRNI